MSRHRILKTLAKLRVDRELSEHKFLRPNRTARLEQPKPESPHLLKHNVLRGELFVCIKEYFKSLGNGVWVVWGEIRQALEERVQSFFPAAAAWEMLHFLVEVDILAKSKNSFALPRRKRFPVSLEALSVAWA